MYTIAIDMGNTRAKAAVFKDNELLELAYGLAPADLPYWCRQQQSLHPGLQYAIVASVGAPAEPLVEALSYFLSPLLLKPGLPLPLQIGYATPASLGTDRIAAAVGAAARFPGQAVLAFDAGTCLTHELVNAEGVYLGGGISPGLGMRLQAMHQFTARLPLAEIDPGALPELPGRSTQESLQAGAFWGMLGEIENTMLRYKEIYPQLGVILCGGDAKTFENKLKEPIFVVSELVLFGLNEILRYNVLQK